MEFEMGQQQVRPTMRSSQNDLSYHSKFLIWLWRSYGVDFSQKNHAHSKLLKIATSVLLCFLVTMHVLLIVSDVRVVVKAISLKETDILYFMIPVCSALLYPIFLYLYVFNKKDQLNQYFIDIIDAIRTNFEVTPEYLRSIIHKWELWLTIIFFCFHLMSFAVHVPLVLFNSEDPFLTLIKNATWNTQSLHLPPISLFLLHALAGHMHMIKFLMAATFVVFCLLLRSAFDALNDDAAKRMKTPTENLLEEFCFKHTKLCLLVERANNLFGTFLATSFALQICNTCFYARCVAFQQSWMTITYHLIVIQVLVLFIAFFLMLCWAAISINEKINYLHKNLFYNGDFRSMDLDNAKINILFYVMNTQANSIQISLFNYFPINKGFVVTVLGTVLTYTVALFGFK